MIELFLAGSVILGRPVEAAAPQLISVENGDFEQAEPGTSFPAGWESNRREDVSLISDAMHGSKAVQVKCPWSWANTELKVKLTKLPEGKEISVGWWVKLDDAKKGDSDSDICKLTMTFKNNAWQDLPAVELAKFEGTAGWKWMTKKKILVPTNLMEAWLVLRFEGGSQGMVSLDRIVVAKGNDLPPETISAAAEIGTMTDQAKAAILRARAAAKRATVEGSAAEALSDARGRVQAVTLLADELEAEAKALTSKAEPRSNLMERAADAERSVAMVRAKVQEAISLIQEGEAAHKRETSRAAAEEISAMRAGEAIQVLREAVEAADRAANAMTASMVLVGTWGGGVWRSTEENKWAATNAESPHPYTAFLTAAPDGRLFCGGTEATLLDSEDNGKTWSATPTRLPAPATGFALDPQDLTRWMVTTWGRGVWVSTDEGRNWSEAPSASKFMRGLRMLRLGAGATARPYAIADNTTVVRAESFGGDWKEVARMPRGIEAWDVAVKPTGSPVLLVASDAGVAEIGESGRLAFPKLEVSTAWARAIITDLDRVLIGTYGGGIVEWRPDSSETPKARLLNTDLANRDVSALVALLHPKPALEAGTETFTGPRVWTERNGGFTGGAANGIAVDPTDDKVLYCTSKSGFFRSEDRGATWVTWGSGIIGRNLGHILIDPKYHETMYLVPADTNTPAGIQKSTDGGKTWAQKNKGLKSLAAMWIACNPDNPSTMISVTWGGGTFISWDGAENWYSMGGIPQQNGYFAVFGAVEPKTVLAGMITKLFRLGSDGKTWEPSDTGIPGQDIWYIAQDPNGGKTWLAGTAGSGLYKSTDDARTWTKVSKGLTSNDIYRVVWHPAKPGVVYIGTKSTSGRGGSGIFRSVDSGESWAPDNESLPSMGIEDLLITPTGLVYAATQNGIYFKQD